MVRHAALHHVGVGPKGIRTLTPRRIVNNNKQGALLPPDYKFMLGLVFPAVSLGALFE
jgi:hypothetical protein